MRDETPTSAAVLFEGLINQGRVIRALLLREMQIRFGRDNIGILWVVLEPMMFATTVTLIHSLAGYGHNQRGQGAFPFTVLGYCLFIIFRNIFNRSEGAINGAASLLYHRVVTLFDVMLARALVDAIGCVSALVLLMSVGIMTDLADFPARPAYLIGAAVLIFWLSFALSLIVAAKTYESHFVARLVHPFSYAMVPLSGAFVTMTFLPAWAREYMAWNPMMSIFEMARYGQFQSASPDYIYIGYTVTVCACLTYWGLVSLSRVRGSINVA